MKIVESITTVSFTIPCCGDINKEIKYEVKNHNNMSGSLQREEGTALADYFFDRCPAEFVDTIRDRLIERYRMLTGK